jgi:hypothetical protein
MPELPGSRIAVFGQLRRPALNLQERTVKLAPMSAWPIGYWWAYNTRYHVESVLEVLDEPGERYLEQ